MLLRAVVQVALDRAALRVAGFDDAHAGRAELVRLAAHLVERLLERGVELHVVQREPDLTCELGERLLVGLGELQRANRASHHDQAEQLARVGDGRDAQHVGVVLEHRGQPDLRPRYARHARPRDHRLFLRADRDTPGTAFGNRHRALEPTRAARPHLGDRERHRLLQ